MSKKLIAVALVALMLLVLPASAAIQADTVEIRGTVANATALTGVTGVSWNYGTFAGFWYDLKDNKSTETLEIQAFSDERTIAKEKIWYNTTKEAIQFKVSKEKGRDVEYGLDSNATIITSTGDQYYAVVGWMAQKYVAINGKTNKLAKLLMEQATADKKTLTVGETWDLGNGYTLTAQSIDAKADPRQAWFVLSKDGVKLDDKVIEAAKSTGTGTQGVYTYYKNVGGESNVPIFVTYVDSVFAGATTDMVQLKYTWLIDTSLTEIKSGDKYGIFKVDSESPVKLKSDSSVTLSKDSTINLAGDMKFRVADSKDGDVRFYPMVVRNTPGTWEVRGTVANATLLTSDIPNSSVSWDSGTFAGFWYDLKDNKSTESLVIQAFKAGDNRSIEKEKIWYNTSKEAIKFKVSKEKNRTVEYGLDSNATIITSTGDQYYAVVGWMAQKYVAINGKTNKLAKLLLEQATADKKTLTVGETWDMGNGYTLTAQSIDAKADPRQAWFVLSKDGVKLDDKVIEAAKSTETGTQGVYTYYKNVGGESNVPIFVTYVDSVFAGATTDMVQLKYTWLIDTSLTEIKNGDKYGIFKVDSESPIVKLKSDSSVTLSKDSTVNLAGEMKFRVSDSNDGDVRFYPMVEYEISGDGETVTTTTTGTATATPTATETAAETPAGETPAGETPAGETPASETPVPEPTKTPGFEAVFAIAGLLAVAFLVLRQRK